MITTTQDRAAPAQACNAGDTAGLDQLALRAQVAAFALGMAAYELRNACDRGHAGDLFTALRGFQAALDDTDRHAGAVTSHAVNHHGYY